LKAGIVGRAGRAHALDDNAVKLIGRVDLLALVGSQIADREAELAGLGATGVVGTVVAGYFRVAVELANGQVQRLRLAVANHAQRDLGSRSHFAHRYLKRAAVDYFSVVDAGDDVALLESAAAGGRIGRYLGNNRAGGVVEVEEVGVLGRYVVHADAEIAMLDLAVLDQLLGGGADDLRGNRKSCAGERSAVGDDEGVDADQFAMRVDQCAAGVAGIDGRVGLDEITRLARVVGVGVGAVKRADDAARDGKRKVSEGTAEGEHGLAGLQPGGVAPGDAGQVGSVDLDDRNVVELVDTDDFAVENAAVMQRDLDVGGAIDDVVVGDDVSVRRDDDAAADAVLDLRALRLHGELAEELLDAGGQSLHHAAGGVVFAGGARGDGNVDHGGRDARGYGFHGVIEGGEGLHAVVVDGGGGVDIAVADEHGCAEGECADDRCRCGQKLGRCY